MMSKFKDKVFCISQGEKEFYLFVLTCLFIGLLLLIIDKIVKGSFICY